MSRAERSLGRGTSRSAILSALVLAGVAYLASGCVLPDDSTAGQAEVVPVPDSADLDAFTASLPEVDVPPLDREMALTLAAMPLSCLDRPHAAAENRRAYLDTIVATRVPGYEENRAFYGCWDWHSAVNSTWAMVRLYQTFPELPLSGLFDEKLGDHLAPEALEGELAFFEENRTFERPYGWAWLVALHAEMEGWDHEEAEAWVEHLQPLARLFTERTGEWLDDLRVPSRSGAHSNTAFALALMLEAARTTGDRVFEETLESHARRLFEGDTGCPTAYEPWGSDFLSPCLEEAALMAAVLDTESFRRWIDAFLPPLTSAEFRPLTSPTDPEDVVEAMEEVEETPSALQRTPADEEDDEGDRMADAERRYLASTSHLIGLAFIRGDAMNRIATALPAGDPRIPALRRLARLHAARGFEALFDADYAGSHWIGTFALKYLFTEEEAAALD